MAGGWESICDCPGVLAGPLWPALRISVMTIVTCCVVVVMFLLER